jgi:CubicO group peptidase (beta-lactamase class C family)
MEPPGGPLHAQEGRRHRNFHGSGARELQEASRLCLLGGAGSVSTLDDYARFVMMLVNDGELDGARILSRKSVELMRSDHLGDLARTGLLKEGYGFGLTFAVNLGPASRPTVGSEGEYEWGGAAGTSFWIDPKEHLIGVFLINVLPSGEVVAAGQFKRMAYDALVD